MENNTWRYKLRRTDTTEIFDFWVLPVLCIVNIILNAVLLGFGYNADKGAGNIKGEVAPHNHYNNSYVTSYDIYPWVNVST